MLFVTMWLSLLQWMSNLMKLLRNSLIRECYFVKVTIIQLSNSLKTNEFYSYINTRLNSELNKLTLHEFISKIPYFFKQQRKTDVYQSKVKMKIVYGLWLGAKEWFWLQAMWRLSLPSGSQSSPSARITLFRPSWKNILFSYHRSIFKPLIYYLNNDCHIIWKENNILFLPKKKLFDWTKFLYIQ